jgi:hypothetical protein
MYSSLRGRIEAPHCSETNIQAHHKFRRPTQTLQPHTERRDLNTDITAHHSTSQLIADISDQHRNCALNVETALAMISYHGRLVSSSYYGNKPEIFNK